MSSGHAAGRTQSRSLAFGAQAAACQAGLRLAGPRPPHSGLRPPTAGPALHAGETDEKIKTLGNSGGKILSGDLYLRKA